MIVLWRPDNIPAVDWSLYRHCWTMESARAGEPITEQIWTPDAEARAWDRINTAPSRTVWVQPSFIPSPSMFGELDMYASDKFAAVALRSYEVLFQPKQAKPVQLTAVGVSPVFLAVQLYVVPGKTLPLASSRSPWQFMEQKDRGIGKLLVAQRWTDMALRSPLGTTYLNPWDGEMGCGGRVVGEGFYWYDKAEQRARWRTAVDAWHLYLRH